MRGNAFVLLVSIVAALGGLLFGYDTGIISAALLFVGHDLNPHGSGLDDLAKQLITSAIVAGALIGCMGAGPISDHLGRRLVVVAAAIIFIAGSVAAAASGSVDVLVISRLVLGLAIGAASQIVPVYIAELAPAARRGGLVVLFQLAVVSGILLSSIVGWLLGASGAWRLMFLLGVVPAVVLLVGLIWLPESPRFQALNGNRDGARQTLLRLRASKTEVDRELEEIEQTVHAERGWKELFQPKLRPALVAGMGVAMFSQITGTNAVIYYAPTILASVGFGKSAALLTSLAIGVTIVGSTIFGIWAVDHWGRRKLMLRFLPLAVLSLVLLGFALFGGTPHGWMRWLAVGGLLGNEIFNVGSISVTIWLIGSEVFPLGVRGKGMSMVALSHWTFDLVISLTTLSLVSSLGAGGAFWLFAFINLLAFGFVWRYVPETRGRTLEQIESDLQSGHFRT
ncbi:sugar porter family MFS transporter [Acidisoma sp. S159]|jgi:major inositol transporter-like SP family MFS transporter|uniref:sugar porter family MFS transporter n=1 Tax=Acidisoma sp. S159 TaxID=1747225 RepID=UPI00131DDBA3|nr:sugar porter family MFS transporter [Acidisoma sp. S159]